MRGEGESWNKEPGCIGEGGQMAAIYRLFVRDLCTMGNAMGVPLCFQIL